MAQSIKKSNYGCRWPLGSHVFAALQAESSSNVSVLSRKCSKSTFVSDIKVYKVVAYLKSQESTGLT
ncbi:hypothetical protein QQZ08_006431 [Neonectria magnoliae]|uniref:Uncharacterized protein n=1 Tax=Neonectria magnoliae TaxID=2732573 RepID=A0ABR1I169_9HYPO